MHVIRRRGWEIPERLATPEHLFFNRRAFLTATGAAALSLSPQIAAAQRVADLPDPSAHLYPVKRNETFTLDRPVTDEKVNTSYNNFYEFGSSKTIATAAQALKLRPWTIKIDGMVEKPQEIGIDDLLAKMPLEERLYRLRCVEAWSMAIPWSRLPDGQAGRTRQAAVVGQISCGWRRSSIPRSRPASGRPGIRGPMSRA